MAELIASPGPRIGRDPRDASPEEPGPLALENRRLRSQYTEIAQLAGGLAHEIRNPLSTMSLNLDLLAEDFQNPETPRDRRVLQKIERLRRESQRLQDILENFLRFARVQELRREPADLNLVVEEMRDFFEPQAMAQGIVIRTQFANDLSPMRLDVDLFRQALLNLLINARQAMPDGGELLLRTRADGPWNVLEVDRHRHRHDSRSTRSRLRRLLFDSRQAAAASACRQPVKSSRPTAARSMSRVKWARAHNSRFDCRDGKLSLEPWTG